MVEATSPNHLLNARPVSGAAASAHIHDAKRIDARTRLEIIGTKGDLAIVDVLTLHLAPVLLGSGTPLFTGGTPRTLAQRSVTPTSTATHLTYDVVP